MTAWITAFAFPELPVLLCATWGTAHIRLQQQLATSLLYHKSKPSVMWHCHMHDNSELFSKCRFHSNQTGHVADARKLRIAKDVWSHLNIISRTCILWWWWWWKWWCNGWHADLRKNDGQKVYIWKRGGGWIMVEKWTSSIICELLTAMTLCGNATSCLMSM